MTGCGQWCDQRGLDSGICSTRRGQCTQDQRVGSSVNLGINNKEQDEGLAQELGWKAAQTPSRDPDGVVLMY